MFYMYMGSTSNNMTFAMYRFSESIFSLTLPLPLVLGRLLGAKYYPLSIRLATLHLLPDQALNNLVQLLVALPARLHNNFYSLLPLIGQPPQRSLIV
jgi:hypothetical protein